MTTHSDPRIAVARTAERVICDYFISTGAVDRFALPKDYEDLVLLLERHGLLTTNVYTCIECDNPAAPNSIRCRSCKPCSICGCMPGST